MLRFAALLVFVVPIPLTTFAQGSDPPQLQPAFSDDFNTDTRADYTVDGDVAWQPGRLTLAKDASIERDINGGSWTKVELGLELPKLSQEQPESELKVWFILDGATSCFVRLHRSLRDGGANGSVILVDTSEKDGKPIEQVVRQAELNDREFGDLSLEYREGLVRVSANSTPLLTAYIENGSATVAAAKVEAVHGLHFRYWRVVASRKAAERTAEENEELKLAATLNLQVVRLWRADKSKDAVLVARRILRIRQRRLGEFHSDTALSFFNLAAQHAALGDYARAEPLYIQAMGIRKSVIGEKHPDYAESLHSLALLYDSMGDYARAEPLYKQALGIRKSVLGEQHSAYATNLNSLAALYKRLGDYARAEPLFKQARDIWKSVLGEQHPHYATSLHNLAALYESLGDYARAEPLYKQTRDILKSVLGEQHPDYAQSLHSLAALYERMGDYSRAEPLYKQALGIRKSVLGEQHPDYASSLGGLAVLYDSMGDYSRSEPLYKQARDIRKSVLGEQHPDYATSLHNLAALYRRMGDYARAVPLYKQALEIRKLVFGEKHPDYAASLHNLAALYEHMGFYARAEPLLKQALEIRKSVLGKRHPRYAGSLHNLAAMYESMGDYTRAEPLYLQAGDIWKSVHGEKHPNYAISLNSLALLYMRMGDDARAESLFKQAMEIQRSVLGEKHPHYAIALSNLTVLYGSMGDYARAEPLICQAVDIAQQNVDESSVVQSERQQKRNLSKQRGFLDGRLSIALRSNAVVAEVLPDLWQWKGAVTFRQQAYRRVASNPNLAPIFESLQSVSHQLSVVSGKTPAPPPSAAPQQSHENYQRKRKLWEARFASLNQQREELEQRIAADSAEFREIREPLTVAAVQELLPAGTAFVDFLDYNHSTPDPDQKGKTNFERRYIVFVVRPDREPAMIGLRSVESLSDAITAFRGPLTAGQSDRKEATRAARQLRDELWLPIEKHLGGIETVILSPDTALGTLPFAALPGEKEGTYLIEQYRFASLPLARMLRTLSDPNPERSQPEKGLLVVGDVNYDANSLLANADTPAESRPASMKSPESMRRSAPRSGDSGWQSLPGFQQELAIVRDQFQHKFGGGVTTLMKDKATEAEFIKQASQHHHLHLITHGFFASSEFEPVASSVDDGPRSSGLMRHQLGGNDVISQYMPGLLSGIVLAGANNPPPTDAPEADGILTASEIEALDLGGVDLVVLSACETGLGKTAGGEGLTGLQRAFQIAGARSCVASLWEVEDKATQELMSRFYRNYWQDGQSKIDALRNAQLDLLRDPSLTRGAPAGLAAKRGKPVKVDLAKRGDQERADPMYWAAFVLSGDWR